MDFQDQGRSYRVRVPIGEETYFRLHDGRSLVDGFRSRHELGIGRRRSHEDAADHRGLSVRATLHQAIALAREQNRLKALTGSRLAPWTHVIEFVVRGGRGHCSARTDVSTAGHHTVWGEAEDFAGPCLRVMHPVDGWIAPAE